jgi:hypothetical protein
MKLGRFAVKPVASAVAALLFSACFAFHLISAEETYSPKSRDEIDVLLLVLRSEVGANNWTKKDLICFSVQGMAPSPELVKAVRQQNLNVCSSAEWPKKFNCGFEVRMRFADFDPSQSARVHAEVVDNRDINAGKGDLAVLQRTGDYAVRRIDGKWSISDYVHSK